MPLIRAVAKDSPFPRDQANKRKLTFGRRFAIVAYRRPLWKSSNRRQAGDASEGTYAIGMPADPDSPHNWPEGGTDQQRKAKGAGVPRRILKTMAIPRTLKHCPLPSLKMC